MNCPCAIFVKFAGVMRTIVAVGIKSRQAMVQAESKTSERSCSSIAWASVGAIIVVYCCWRCTAAESDFYGTFLSLSNTNDPTPRLMTSPLLVDTNNSSRKLANTVISLESLKAEGKTADLRLGMTMNEVVTRWGKPVQFYSVCGGGPRFDFADASLRFRQDRLVRIYLRQSARFDHDLSGRSSLKEWVAVLGQPTGRRDTEHGSTLSYEMPGGYCFVLTFEPDGEVLFPPGFHLISILTNQPQGKP